MTLQSTEASPATEIEVQGVATDPTSAADPNVVDANAAESSNADIEDAKQEAPLDLRDVIKDVVKKPEPAESDSSNDTVQQEATVEGKAQAGPEQKAEDVPFHNHPRWKELKAERDSYREGAENYRKITDFMANTGLEPSEVAEGFQVMASLKSGTLDGLEQALAYFEEKAQLLRQMTGRDLPQDLASKVNDGLVDEEVAREFARSQAASQLQQNQFDRQRQLSEQTAAEQARQQTAASMAQAVQGWEDGIKAKDPDYATKKEALVLDRARVLQGEVGAPKTPEEAIALVDRAYKEVNDRLRSILPARRPVSPPPASMSARVSPVPKSLGDAVRAAVNR